MLQYSEEWINNTLRKVERPFYKFDICVKNVPTGVINLCEIHPRKQQLVCDIVKFVDKVGLKRIIVFGSSLTWNCYADSDLDICFDGTDKAVSKAFLTAAYLSYGDIDIFDYNDIDIEFKEVIDNGVTVYTT